MNENYWNEIIDNAENAVLRKAKEELGEEPDSDTIIEWLETQQVAMKGQQGYRAGLKENLLQFISAQS